MNFIHDIPIERRSHPLSIIGKGTRICLLRSFVALKKDLVLFIVVGGNNVMDGPSLVRDSRPLSTAQKAAEMAIHEYTIALQKGISDSVNSLIADRSIREVINCMVDRAVIPSLGRKCVSEAMRREHAIEGELQKHYPTTKLTSLPGT